MPLGFIPSLKDFPFDVHKLSIKFEMTSKTCVLDVEEKTSNEPPQDLDGPTDPKPLNSDDIEKSIATALREVLPSAIPARNRRLGQTCIFRFNMHKNPNNDVMIRFKDPNPLKDKIGCIPGLRIAYGDISWETENESKDKEVYCPVLKMQVPLFREPERTLFIHCGPLLLISVLSLCGFILEPTEISSRLAIAAANSLALVSHLPTCMQHTSVRTVTCVDVVVLQTIAVLVLFFAASVEGAIGNQETHYVHTLFPIIAGLLVFFLISYLLVRYIDFLIRRPKMLQWNKFSAAKKNTLEFDDTDWHVIGADLPNSCEELLGPEDVAERTKQT
jgi:hypothetical protein